MKWLSAGISQLPYQDRSWNLEVSWKLLRVRGGSKCWGGSCQSQTGDNLVIEPAAEATKEPWICRSFWKLMVSFWIVVLKPQTSCTGEYYRFD